MQSPMISLRSTLSALCGLWMLAAAAAPSRADAACPATRASLGAQIDAGLAAYDDFEWATFAQRVADVSTDLPCLSQRLSPEEAARVHLFLALSAARAKLEPETVASLRGLLAAAPDFQLKEDWAPPGSLLRRALDTARAAPPLPTQPLRDEGWVLDGHDGLRALPTGRAMILQRLVGNQVSQSWYLTGGDLPKEVAEHIGAPPEATPPVEKTPEVATAPVLTAPLPAATPAPAATPPPLAAPVSPGTSTATKSSPKKKHTSSWMMGAAGLSAVGTGVSLAMASSIYNQYVDTTDEQVYSRAVSANHAAVISGGALGVATATLAVSALVVWKW